MFLHIYFSVFNNIENAQPDCCWVCLKTKNHFIYIIYQHYLTHRTIQQLTLVHSCLSYRLSQEELRNFDSLMNGACQVVLSNKETNIAKKQFRCSLLSELQMLNSDNEDESGSEWDIRNIRFLWSCFFFLCKVFIICEDNVYESGISNIPLGWVKWYQELPTITLLFLELPRCSWLFIEHTLLIGVL